MLAVNTFHKQKKKNNNNPVVNVGGLLEYFGLGVAVVDNVTKQETSSMSSSVVNTGIAGALAVAIGSTFGLSIPTIALLSAVFIQSQQLLSKPAATAHTVSGYTGTFYALWGGDVNIKIEQLWDDKGKWLMTHLEAFEQLSLLQQIVVAKEVLLFVTALTVLMNEKMPAILKTTVKHSTTFLKGGFYVSRKLAFHLFAALGWTGKAIRNKIEESAAIKMEDFNDIQVVDLDKLEDEIIEEDDKKTEEDETNETSFIVEDYWDLLGDLMIGEDMNKYQEEKDKDKKEPKEEKAVKRKFGKIIESLLLQQTVTSVIEPNQNDNLHQLVCINYMHFIAAE